MGTLRYSESDPIKISGARPLKVGVVLSMPSRCASQTVRLRSRFAEQPAQWLLDGVSWTLSGHAIKSQKPIRRGTRRFRA